MSCPSVSTWCCMYQQVTKVIREGKSLSVTIVGLSLIRIRYHPPYTIAPLTNVNPSKEGGNLVLPYKFQYGLRLLVSIFTQSHCVRSSLVNVGFPCCWKTKVLNFTSLPKIWFKLISKLCFSYNPQFSHMSECHWSCFSVHVEKHVSAFVFRSLHGVNTSTVHRSSHHVKKKSQLSFYAVNVHDLL